MPMQSRWAENCPTTASIMATKLKGVAGRLFVLLFWLTVWELAALAVDRELLVPAPTAVFARLWELIREKSFWLACLSSLGRMAGGYAVGVSAGVLLAFGAHWCRPLRMLISPVFTVIRATPVASFILIALVWIGGGRVPVFTAFLMVLPIVWGGTVGGLESVGRELPEMARVFSLSPWRKLRYLYLPAVRPSLLSACVTAVGLAWKASVAAEVLCVSGNSVGLYLYRAKLYLETVDLYAWTVAVILLSLTLETALKAAVRRLTAKGGKCAHA